MMFPRPATEFPTAVDMAGVTSTSAYLDDELRTRVVLTALTPRDATSVLRVTVEDVRRMVDEVPDAPAFDRLGIEHWSPIDFIEWIRKTS